MTRQVLVAIMLAVAVSGPACDRRAPAGTSVNALVEARKMMTVRVRLGEGFQNDTVTVRVDGKQVYHRAGVSTDWTISRADSVETQTDAANVQLEVSVQGGPSATQAIDPAQTPFVEVRLVNDQLQLLPMGEEPPML